RTDHGSLSEAPLRPSEDGADVTQAGTRPGTLAYMSPQLASGRQDLLGPTSDVYSLGATLYAILTGQPPYRGKIVETLEKVQRGQYMPPRVVKPSTPPALDAICRKGMAFEPKD